MMKFSEKWELLKLIIGLSWNMICHLVYREDEKAIDNLPVSDSVEEEESENNLQKQWSKGKHPWN